MRYRVLTAGGAVCVLSLLGFTGQADATPRLTLKASPSPASSPKTRRTPRFRITRPRVRSGAPGGPSQPTPDDQPGAGGQMQAQPEGGGGETNAIDQEEGK